MNAFIVMKFADFVEVLINLIVTLNIQPKRWCNKVTKECGVSIVIIIQKGLWLFW